MWYPTTWTHQLEDVERRQPSNPRWEFLDRPQNPPPPLLKELELLLPGGTLPLPVPRTLVPRWKGDRDLARLLPSVRK